METKSQTIDQLSGPTVEAEFEDYCDQKPGIEYTKPEVANSDTPEDDTGSYRCPGCGELVDKGDVSAIRLHHAHILHRPSPPRSFQRPRLVL